MPRKITKRNQHLHEGSMFAPIAFIVLFILFIYIPLLVGLLLVARWIIDAYHLTFFQNLDIWGDLLMLVFILSSWIGIVLAISIIPYWILRAKGQFILAEKVMIIVQIFLFHIFVFPCICWRMVRMNSPYLRQRYRQKLKKMITSKKMQERRSERHRRMQKKMHASLHQLIL